MSHKIINLNESKKYDKIKKIKETEEYQKMNWVIKNVLAVGDMDAASDIPFLKKHNIKAIVTARGPLSHKREHYHQHGINVFHIPVADDQMVNIGKYFPVVFSFVEREIQKGHGVLIHCAAGISRSVTLTLSYLIRKYNMSTKEAIEYLTKLRPCINPNPGFLNQLVAYENLLKQHKHTNNTHHGHHGHHHKQ